MKEIKIYSIQELSIQIDQLNDWKILFFNFVDSFRKNPDLKLIKIGPNSKDPRINALLAAAVADLCREQNIEIPNWFYKVDSLQEPWFVSGIENLKASALKESPIFYKMKNIFVLDNFLSRV